MDKLRYTRKQAQETAQRLYKQVEGEGYTIGALLSIAYFFLEEVILHFDKTKKRNSLLLKAYFKQYAMLLTRHFTVGDVTRCAGLLIDEACSKCNNEHPKKEVLAEKAMVAPAKPCHISMFQNTTYLE